jgi:hypothetical protein
LKAAGEGAVEGRDFPFAGGLNPIYDSAPRFANQTLYTIDKSSL